MRHHSSSPREMVAALWRHRELIRASVKREVLGRYRGSVLGMFWSFVNPLLMLSIYTFVFSEVFKARWGGGGESKTEFALVLFAGLIVFNLFSECVSRAPGLIVGNVNYVKKVVFPLEILPFVTLVSALYHALVSLFVWLLAYTVLVGMPHLTTLLLPLVFAPLCVFTLGVSWLLASLGVFLRDIAQLIGAALSVLMFLSPIFYPVGALPERYRGLMFLNPLTPVIEELRAVLVFGRLPNVVVLAWTWAVALVVMWLGFVWFQRTRTGFADVI